MAAIIAIPAMAIITGMAASLFLMVSGVAAVGRSAAIPLVTMACAVAAGMEAGAGAAAVAAGGCSTMMRCG